MPEGGGDRKPRKGRGPRKGAGDREGAGPHLGALDRALLSHLCNFPRVQSIFRGWVSNTYSFFLEEILRHTEMGAELGGDTESLPSTSSPSPRTWSG